MKRLAGYNREKKNETR